MAKKKPSAAVARPQPAAADAPAAPVLLALTVLLAPALGVPGEEMLQDTLKSTIVAFGTLGAAMLFLFANRGTRQPLRWHGIVWLPLLLMAYALGSMAWSHTYLAGVEAIRWFLFALIAWLALNTFTRERLPLIAWCAHGGAVLASLWAVLQFWFALSLFPQGPQPSSTFINRNFFAEFVVCALPFSALLLARARAPGMALGLAASIGFVLTALLMTGTRSALVALWLQVLVVLPVIAWRCRAQFAFAQWPARLRLLVPAVLVGTVLALGAIPTQNRNILEEGHGATALARGFKRAQSIGPQDHSLGIRMLMWRATANVIEARPLTGVGAGAWESEVPLYQEEGAQLETDYYVHNEFLQLGAEYGVVGWIFLLLLVACLLLAAWRSWGAAGAEADAERPWRAVLLCSLLALMVVSSIGFPWRLASTGALFALCLGALAASDTRLGFTRPLLARPLRWSPAVGHASLAATAACLVLALVITQKAAESERKLVTAARIALSISATGDPNHPRYQQARRQMLQLVREGVAINPHYRKVTPVVADELARWGDWKNATWIWESVLQSRPNVVAILTNAARGHDVMGDTARARMYLERAKRIQPRATVVRSLEVILLTRDHQEALAMQRAKEALDAGVADFDLVNAYAILAWRARDYPLALELLQRRIREYPESRARGLVQIGMIYADGLNDPARALAAFRDGVAAASREERPLLLAQVPPAYRAQLAGAAP